MGHNLWPIAYGCYLGLTIMNYEYWNGRYNRFKINRGSKSDNLFLKPMIPSANPANEAFFSFIKRRNINNLLTIGTQLALLRLDK